MRASGAEGPRPLVTNRLRTVRTLATSTCRSTAWRSSILALVRRPASVAVGVELLRPLLTCTGSTTLEPSVDAAVRRFVATGDPAALLAIVGVGEGLTPAGDDVIVGVLAALDALSDCSVRARPRRKACVASLASGLEGRTTRLAAQLVESACEGEYAEPLRDLLHCMASSPRDDTSLLAAAHAVAALGHDSGVSLLRGLVAGIDSA